MKSTYCYLPILRAKEGEFRAVQQLSSPARSRICPMFDVGEQNEKTGLDEYLKTIIENICNTRGRNQPSFIDVHDIPLDIRTQSGLLPISYIFNEFRKLGSRVVPVTGVEAERDIKYLLAVKDIIQKDNRGACLRLSEDDISDTNELNRSINELLKTLGIPPAQIDVVIDTRYVPKYKPLQLQGLLIGAIQEIRSIGTFRSQVIAGSSVPESHGKKFKGMIRREPRVELNLWKEISKILGIKEGIAFGDYGVIYPYFVQPNGPVRPPARIRYTTQDEFISFHGSRNEYNKLCKHLINEDDFSGKDFSNGDLNIYHRAMGMDGLGGPSDWVTTDTIHHIELVSNQIWRYLVENQLTNGYLLSQSFPEPFLQQDLELPTEV